jgi:stage II sporulation protein M
MRGWLTSFWIDLRRSKHYLIASLIAFAAGWAAGATGYGGMDRLAEQTMESMRELAGMIGSADNPQLMLFLFIFINNAVKAAMFVLSGALFGVLPIFVLITNGTMLGWLLQNPVNPEMGGLELFARGILPHGIVELPALIIACAYGIRFGFLLIRTLFLSFVPARRERAGEELRRFLAMLVPLMALLTVAMFVAAVIETTVTPALLR